MSVLERIKRSKFATFMNTGTSEAEVYERMGKGISEMKEELNPEETSEKDIHEDVPTNEVESYAPSFNNVSQRTYVGEPIFEKIESIYRKLGVGEDAKVDMLKVFLYDKLAENTFGATKFNATIVINSYEGNTIEYSIKQNGNQTEGYVTITDGKPAFTEGDYKA